MTPLPQRLFNRLHVALYRMSRGRIGGRLLGMDVLLLSTTGRKSGRPRTTPLAYFRDSAGVFVIGAAAGAPAHPAWYHNLCAEQRCRLQLGGTQLDVLARVVTGAERKAMYGRFRERAPQLAEDYESKTPRTFPVVHFAISE